MDERLAACRRGAQAAPDDGQAWGELARALSRAGAAPAALLDAAGRARALGVLDVVPLERLAWLRRPAPLDAEALAPLIRTASGVAAGVRPGWTVRRAGAFDPASGTLAWVEDRRGPEDRSVVDCDVTLHLARGGRVLRSWPLEHYNPYFGTTVHHIQVAADHALVLYHEKHGNLAARVLVDAHAPPAVVPVGGAFLLLPDRLVSEGDAPGTLRVRTIPALEAAPPIAIEPPLPDGHLDALALDEAGEHVVATWGSWSRERGGQEATSRAALPRETARPAG